MVQGRPMPGLAQRVASVVSCRPARWRAPTARFLKGAVARGPERVRTVELSSRQRVSRSQCRDSIARWPRTREAMAWGLARVAVQAGDAERGNAGRRRANDTIEHGVAPAGEGPQEDTWYYRGFASLHDQARRADTRPGRNITSPQPGNGQR
jgi:hypothetical protein